MMTRPKVITPAPAKARTDRDKSTEGTAFTARHMIKATVATTTAGGIFNSSASGPTPLIMGNYAEKW
jgi:hypothetical protein